MSKHRLIPVAAVLAAFGAVLLVGSPAVSGSEQPAGVAKSKHKTGKYKGKVGTFARIFFKASKKKVKGLNAGVKTNCQRASDGVITRTQVVATKSKKKLKVNKKGKFKGKGQEDDGVAWKLKGKFVSKKKAKGKFEASYFVFNPFTFDSELCSGSGKWTARR
ncbi:MAG TPA: hypothetical protein VKA36_04575 [Solirubrobacterales bacterium]|nr:hypothetical protein [Solirubrobacterales bacterium]